jgi:hypothetical protein
MGDKGLSETFLLTKRRLGIGKGRCRNVGDFGEYMIIGLLNV